MVLKQQQRQDLEQYINLTTDVVVNKNVLPAVTVLDDYFDEKQHININKVLMIVGQKHCGKLVNIDLKLNQYAIIKVKSTIELVDGEKWSKDKLHSEYSKYKDNYINGDEFPPILLTHSGVLNSLFDVKLSEELFQLDGMHRVMSSLEAGLKEIDTYVLVRRCDLHKFMTNEDKLKINQLGSKCSWFPRYQEIREVGLVGQRTQEPRFTDIYDFSNLRDKVVVDFGGNLGQSAIEAYFNGAKRIVNFDYQGCVVDTGRKISEVLGLGIEYHTIDFNLNSFENDVYKVIGEWDWTIYQAIYRTREIKDVNKSFTFIVNNTKEGLFFEGNGEATIDTPEFYSNVFAPFNFKEVKYLGHSQLRPAYKIDKL